MHSNKDNGRNDTAQDLRSDEIDLKESVLTLLGHRWLILAVMAVVFIIALVYVAWVPTQYQSSALIQIENKQSGLDALQGLSLGAGVTGGAHSALPSEVEMALIRSRYILEPTIEQHHLNLKMLPHYFLLFGSAIAKRHGNKTLAKPFWGLSSYAWGGEAVDVAHFKVPTAYFSKRFTLVAGSHGAYQLYAKGHKLVLSARIGRLGKSKVLPGLEMRINKLKANKGTQFYLFGYPMNNAIKELNAALTVSDLGGTQSETGILKLTLHGTNPKLLPRILNTITHYEVQKNIEKKSEEVRQTLHFLNQQLPLVKKDLDKSETALSNYRAQTGTLGLSMEAQALLDQLVSLEKDKENLKLKKSELLLRFASQHPLILALDSEQAQLANERAAIRQKISALPKSEQRALSLERDAKVSNQMYLLLLTKIQQLQIIKAGTVSDVRVLDSATQSVPLPSRKLLILIGSLLLGFVLAVLIVFIRKMFEHGAGDPDYVEQQLGISAYAIIPYSKRQEDLARNMAKGVADSGPFILADVYPRDLSIEGLRSLRTLLQFSLLEAKNNIISVMGAAPSIGKSFVSANLAYVLADSGKSVLLIDADMRKGKMGRYLSQESAPGLAELLQGATTLDRAIHTVKPGQVDFIPAGKYPKNPSELLLTETFGQVLKVFSSRYDVVIIDTPPVLAVTDGVVVGKYSDTNLFVIGSKKDSLKEIEHSISRLSKNNVAVSGLIFNSTTESRHAYGSYGSYRYNYYYDYEHKEE